MRVEKPGYEYDGFKLGQRVIYGNKERIVIGFVKDSSYSIAINACYHMNISESAYKDNLIVLEGFETSQFLWVSGCNIKAIEQKYETVLEIEYEKVFDEYAVRISKQNEDILQRGKFEDTELNVYSKYCFDLESSNLFLRGICDNKDNKSILVCEENLEIIKTKVKLINEKYRILKRWRANKDKMYYYIDSRAKIDTLVEYFDEGDDARYSYGNYFKTKEDAEKKLAKIKEILKDV